MAMTDDEFDAYCEHHRLTPAARTFIAQVRGDVPARRVGGGSKNVVNRFASRKMGFVVQAESEIPEFAYAVLLEYDADALEFYDQPQTLYVDAKNRMGRAIVKRYTPDFLVLSMTQGPMLVECKTDEFVLMRLEKSDPNWWINQSGEAHYEPGRAWAVKQGLGFRVIKNSDLPAKRVQNLMMLADYFFPEVTPATDEIRKRIRQLLKSPPWASRRQLLDSDSAIDADALNWMIAHKELYVDLDNSVLADDVRTLIFRDQAAAEAYAALQRSEASEDPLAIRAVSLETGSVISWDGVTHTVLQVGETNVFLQSTGNSVQTVSLVDCERMIAQGLMVAPYVSTTTSQAACERLRTASPRDLEAACERLAKLEPGPQEPRVPSRTREWYRQLFREGLKLYGNGFLGLIPRISQRGNRKRKLSQAVLEVMEEIVNEYILVATPWTVTACYGEARLRCTERSMRPPSEQTFRRHVKRIRKELIAAATMGHKAAHQHEPWHVQLSYRSPRHGQRPFEIGHIDHTELDVFFVDERYRKKEMRAWLTVLLDAYSRKALSWFLTFDKPSYRSVMCVIRECLRRHGRGCDTYVVDQGAEFNSTHFEVLLGRLGAHKRQRPAGKARFGSLIERFFGISTTALLRQLPGSSYLVKNPRLLAKSHDPRQHAVWTLQEFESAWEGWIENCYHKQEHATLGVSPNVAFDEGLRRYGNRAHRRFVFDDSIRMLCLPAVSGRDEKLKVDGQKGHVKVHGIFYHGVVLRDGKLHGKRVLARFDPFDATRLWVYIDREWHELRCAFAGDLEGLSLAQLRIMSEELRAHTRHGNHIREHNLELLAHYMRDVRRQQDKLQVSTQTAGQRGADIANRSSHGHHLPTFDVEAHWTGVGGNPTGEF